MADESAKRRPSEENDSGLPRFDATIHPGQGAKDLAGLDDMPLDRMPDRYGRVRVLVTPEECARLLDLGYQVRLHRHHPIEPLDASLIATDESVQRWLDEILSVAPLEPPSEQPNNRPSS